MSAVDALLTLLVEDTRNVAAQMTATRLQRRRNPGRLELSPEAGYTEATGLGQDRPTDAGDSQGSPIPPA
ncbi:MAG: hypothetical protein LC739_06250 [Actinobacteria bacterium]|nr:hypothetical protein [Actinomycetota bacterium]